MKTSNKFLATIGVIYALEAYPVYESYTIQPELEEQRHKVEQMEKEVKIYHHPGTRNQLNEFKSASEHYETLYKKSRTLVQIEATGLLLQLICLFGYAATAPEDMGLTKKRQDY